MNNEKTETPSAYAQAGVNIDNKMSALKAVKTLVSATKTVNVVGGIGSFGGLCRLPQGSSKDTLLVSSTDGVGTKLKVAMMMKKHDTVGQDIVNHCVNDILVQGAKPLFFMDYVGTSKFDGPIFQQIVAGLCKACKENNMALLGGETAEMPGLYPVNEYDLVGTIVGTVSKKQLITGQSIRAGDVVIGLPSNGLQTNGYSLARKVFFDQLQMSPFDKLPGTDQTVGDALLAVHKSFLKPVQRLIDNKIKINGMAHITGGGFPDNIPRVLPKATMCEIDRTSWNVPHIFKFIEKAGKVNHDEMYRVFNMGIGFVLIMPKSQLARMKTVFKNIRQPWHQIGVIRVRKPATAPQVYFSK
ncbi:MAG: phosphoribosylformylglycinamidine cyclo-ligase [Kiritimatiellae bacterium]|nr:phosphoribosylformylglycinamidine cyclo-ligase [Kiritimatiellia bacterium]